MWVSEANINFTESFLIALLCHKIECSTFSTCVIFVMQSFDDPFGDTPFKAIPTTDAAPTQAQSSAPQDLFHPTVNQNAELSQTSKVDTVPDFGDSLYSISYSAQNNSLNSQFLPQELSTSEQETDILADILPPSGPSPAGGSQVSYPTATGQPAMPGANMYGGFQPQPASMTPITTNMAPPMPSGVTPNLAPQMASGSAGQLSGGNFIPQSNSPVMNHHQGGPAAQTASPFMNSFGGPGPQYNGGNYLPRQGSGVSPTAQMAHQTSPVPQQNNDMLNNFLPQAGSNPSVAAQPSEPSSTTSLAIVPQPQPAKEKKFEPKSAIWADTLSRGLVNFNISGRECFGLLVIFS